ncbi:hypothetical protein ACHAWU_010370 [Discostella pseudostelligera]|uniref:SUZ domain-containing protein n=1 Tax=Discostella pseudostelligera TaxID=259834 RepID=A0ABD3MQ92_9STRA
MNELGIISGNSATAGNDDDVVESDAGVSRADTQIDNTPPTQNDDVLIEAINAAPWNPLEEVDSALLSALCDPRERKALYRLEQVMIDFMKDKSSWSMEVGGAFNAIVLYQNNSGGANNDNRGDETADGQQLHVMSQQGMQELQHQQQRGLKQTSFQRLILHRLADRFNVIREQIIQPYFPPVGNERGLVDVGAPSHYSPGLIRLMKTSESSIPSNLLIDINLSLLVNYKNPRARNYFGGGNDDGTKYITDNLASTTLEAQPSMVMSKSSKKMVIMKRSDSSNGSGGNLGGNRDGKKDKTRRKKLEDREKAYEEARARIFGASESSGNENNGGDAGAEGGEARQSGILQSQDSQEYASTPLNSSSNHSSFSVENDANVPLTHTTAAESFCSAQPSLPSTVSSSHLPEPQRDQDSANLPSGAAPSETDASIQPSFSSSTSSAPAAVTKAVYRNRQQEENDPDFKRRSGVRPSYIPYVTNPYGHPNPYAAMGQQPPQMVSLHMQQPPHFYHGQAQQYQIPQDASYAANFVNNALYQWAAPQHGYYPSIQQQQQQQQVQENLPQPWKNRPNSSQISSSGVAPQSMNTSHSQPKQPAKIMWGTGMARGDSNAGGDATSGDDAVAYTPEDFPALG